MTFFDGLFEIQSFFTLMMLILLQAVLGFDNLLYISIESKRVPESKRGFVRKWGIGLAIALRIVLLLLLMVAIEKLSAPFFKLHWPGYFEVDVNVHAFIVIAGGIFIIYTAVKEIYHMLAMHDPSEEKKQNSDGRSVASAIFWIVIMNMIFSFDSILSAIALTKKFFVIAASIVVSGVMMMWLSDQVSSFLHKNRMYEVLGLFILFIVGIMLLGEGGHLAELSFFGHRVEPMAKSTFYFVLIILVIVDVVQSRYQKKLLAQGEAH
ncbi:MAG: hypothetical protein KDB03_18340 [Planctomycetales bacterium]|nr:hypothetical protein [Planctomycetales bacterium]